MKHLLFCCLALAVLSSCDQRRGSGNIVTEKRQTRNFTGVKVGGAFEVEMKSGPSTEVVVESDDNIIQYIQTKVSGNVLEISTNHSMGFSNAHYKVFITAPEINSLDISGAANVKAKDQLKSSGKISFEISGAGEVVASVDAPEVESEISGAGNMELSGRTRNQKAKITGSGDLKAADLLSENADVDVSGAGSAKVHASVTLKAEASGAGNISYKGGASVQQKTSGAGSVKNDN